MKMKHHQVLFHGIYANLTGYPFLSITIKVFE